MHIIAISLSLWIGLAAGLTAVAEGQGPGAVVTVRGQIMAVNGLELTVAGPEAPVKAALSDKTVIRVEVPIKLSEITAGMYLGTTAIKQSDGHFLASQVHVFSEDQRGAGEGHRPLSSAPQSGATMTNAHVEQVEDVAVEEVKGRTMVLRYKGGTVKVLVPAQTPVVKRIVSNREALKPGLPVSLQGTRREDGSLAVIQVTVRASGR